jgi:hypothetical protein
MLPKNARPLRIHQTKQTLMPSGIFFGAFKELKLLIKGPMEIGGVTKSLL